jgi:hypothetical protein
LERESGELNSEAGRSGVARRLAAGLVDGEEDDADDEEDEYAA